MENNSGFVKITYPRGFEVFRDYSQVPIDEVANSLGIDLTQGNKMSCPCPDHEDKNPSAEISRRGKYENKWKCWSCGEGGGVVELVMAVKDGINPSEYYSTLKNGTSTEKHKMLIARDNAMIYLNNLFPGIIEVSSGENTKKENELPELPDWILKNYGLPRYFDKPFFVKVRSSSGEEVREKGQLSKIDAAEMVLGKLIELENNLWDMKEKFYELYPHIKDDVGLRLTMDASVKAKIEEVVSYEDKYRSYIKGEYESYDKAQDNTPWRDMSDEDFLEAFKSGKLDEGLKDTERSEDTEEAKEAES